MEMDDLTTEIDNNDKDAEEVRTVIRKSESYPVLSKNSRKSYPPLSKYASANEAELQSGNWGTDITVDIINASSHTIRKNR